MSLASEHARPMADPRALLRGIRNLMADEFDPQDRLDAIVGEIAGSMAADVCSVYVLRADSVLELYATRGLKPEAVHISQLAVGDGLVGTIAANARPLALEDAQSHPAFRYLPETGEERFHSFLGVPIVRGGRTMGVVTVQHRDAHAFDTDEVEALETVAMVLAEMVAGGELSGLTRTGVALDAGRSVTIPGTGLSDGIGLGHVVLHKPRARVDKLFAEDTEAEIVRLDRALRELRDGVDEMLGRREVAGDGEHRGVLEAYRMFAADEGWRKRLHAAVRLGLSAEGAVEKVQADTRSRMMNVTDPFLRERLVDLGDLANRLLLRLTGRDVRGRSRDLPRDGIIITRSMAAAELLDYPAERIRGLVMEDGASTSHVAIVARAMGLPAIGQVRGIVAIAESNDEIIVDGDEGLVHLRPPPDLEGTYAEKVRFRARRQQRYAALRETPAVCAGGTKFELCMNAGLLADMEQLSASGAAGIGLFRTELQFMVATQFPKVDAQERLYRSVLDAAEGKPVTFRLLDIGGDKALPYFRAGIEENPALGWRAVRLSLDRPALMRMQMRAMLRAAAGRTLRIMVPMITCLSEMAASRALLDRELEHADKHERAVPDRIEFGAMLEVPALLPRLEELMEVADFVSVGSNDLFQFFMAADRGNARMGGRYDTLHPAFLRVLRDVAQASERSGTPVTVCGEIGARPVGALALVALGFRSLSMSAAGIGPVKEALIGLDLRSLTQVVNEAVDAVPKPDETQPPSLRPIIERFANERGIPL